jgi:ATPase subunit of ABC transporter with duplicated ATPase domains
MIKFPIVKLHNISLQLPHKICFEGFSHTVFAGDKIAIIGNNGVGKSTLLKIVSKIQEPSEGQVIYTRNLTIGYVAQIIEGYNSLSGAEKFNKSLSKTLSIRPDILLLDEPTNHLDLDNKQSLIRMLEGYRGTVIIVSHETSLLAVTDSVWHIKNQIIRCFSCSYQDYLNNLNAEKEALLNQIKALKHEKKQAHENLMFEQKRAKHRKQYGQKKYDGDKLTLKGKKQQGQATTAKRTREILTNRSIILEKIQSLHIEQIDYKFSLGNVDFSRDKVIVSVREGACFYGEKQVLDDINFDVRGGDFFLLSGKNGSGKSTLMKALYGDQSVAIKGKWLFPEREYIGYLDQHYRTLNGDYSVFDIIKNIRTDWNDQKIREHLNMFLFRHNVEVTSKVSTLSGGEKMRLALARIAANPPRILYLDEPTNNLDMEAKHHLATVLKAYPGAILAISHDEDFFKKIGFTQKYLIKHCSTNNQL